MVGVGWLEGGDGWWVSGQLGWQRWKDWKWRYCGIYKYIIISYYYKTKNCENGGSGV